MLCTYLTMATGLLPLLSSATPIAKRSISDNPLLPDNFPDPSFIKVGDTYYAFATNTNNKHAPIATSPDFNTWTLTDKDALPRVGAWSTGANVWASDVMQLPNNGGFVLYYSAESTDASHLHCVGAATSATVDGEYTPLDAPIACPIDQGGAIDPAGFIDADNTLYVTYKVDGNSIGSGGNCNNGDGAKATPLMLQILDDDGVTPRDGVGPEQILDRDDRDGPLVEAPSLSRIADSTSAGGWLYVLFFSSNCYAGALYDTSYAVSTTSVHGPYEKAKAPLLVTGKLYSPGGMDTAIDIGLEQRVVFHADVDQKPDTRQMWGGTIQVDVGARTISI